MISVIIPHFERVELLRETLQSLERQSSSAWEAVIVDDGSSEPCWNELQTLATAGIRVLRRSDGLRGPSRCRNIGIAASTGAYVMFLDSDDLLSPACIGARMECAAAFPDRDFWIFPAELFRQTPGDLQEAWNDLSEQGDDLERFLRSDGPWCVSSGLWTRAALERLGGFNERVLYGDDADLHVRALLGGMVFHQFLGRPADIFVRRSDAPRITGSGLTPGLLESRLIRLSEGTRALAAADVEDRLWRIWEGQYFMEGEFLLFNAPEPFVRLRRLQQQWRAEARTSAGWIQRRLAWCYLYWSSWWKNRWYLQVRIARRLLMACLPASWFGRARAAGVAT